MVVSKRRAKAFAGNIRDQEGRAIILHRKNVEVVAADREAGNIHAADREMREIAEPAREKRLLNVARDAEFLLQALALALVFDQARVVQNAGGFDGEGVENLAFEFGERGRAAGIEIQNAEKMPAFGMDRGFASNWREAWHRAEWPRRSEGAARRCSARPAA